MMSELKLSDAIEAGWKLAPQSWRDGWGRQKPDGTWIGVCAVGAAILGADSEISHADMYMETALNFFPQLLSPVSDDRLPEGIKNVHEDGILEVGDVIQGMNDALHRPGVEIVTYLRQLGY